MILKDFLLQRWKNVHSEPLTENQVGKLKILIRNQFGFTGRLPYRFFRSGKDKIWIRRKNSFSLDLDEFRISRWGIYFCRTDFMEKVRFSIEGSQIVGPKASKKILELGNDKVKEWMIGHDLRLAEEQENGFYLIRNKKDFLGCGKVVDNTRVWNYIPKTRRI